MGTSSVSKCGVITPRFWTVSCTNAHDRTAARGMIEYRSVTHAVVVVIGYAGIYWLVSARNWFTGPRVQGSAAELAAIEQELSA